LFPDLARVDQRLIFGRYRGTVEMTAHRGTYQVAVERTHDYRSGRYSFYRLEAEARQPFRGLRPTHRLTVHGLVSRTDPNAVVPFYLQYTLGGGGLNTFRPDTMGTDGSNATLRGYATYRFRDRDILLAQAEYRFLVWRAIEATVFHDVGRSAGGFGHLTRHLRHDTGFSVSVMRNGSTLGRIDVGFGGGEGVHAFWTFGGVRP
jgi:hypothetical protein